MLVAVVHASPVRRKYGTLGSGVVMVTLLVIATTIMTHASFPVRDKKGGRQVPGASTATNVSPFQPTTTRGDDGSLAMDAGQDASIA